MKSLLMWFSKQLLRLRAFDSDTAQYYHSLQRSKIGLKIGNKIKGTKITLFSHNNFKQNFDFGLVKNYTFSK